MHLARAPLGLCFFIAGSLICDATRLAVLAPNMTLEETLDVTLLVDCLPKPCPSVSTLSVTLARATSCYRLPWLDGSELLKHSLINTSRAPQPVRDFPHEAGAEPKSTRASNHERSFHPSYTLRPCIWRNIPNIYCAHTCLL